ncbi:MAG TPA: hypothetical protein VFM48_08275 [Aquabacterium sp.]|nr:hypothetical protein [Aquabacterium sp.]
MLIRRFNYLARIFRRPDAGDGSDLGGAPAADSAPAPAPAPATEPAAPAAAPAPAAPTTMLEAMSAAIAPAPVPAADGSQPRDNLGRFAPKTPAEQAQADQAVAAAAANGTAQPAVDQSATPADEDPLKMPEGLGEKAQARFQQLANTVKEQTAWREEVEPQLNYIKETFHSNGISQEQFQTAVDFIGALNRGDVQKATTILQAQMQELALITGQPLQADPLANYQDLRDAVDNLQITEAHAIELARARMQTQAVTQSTQRQQQAQQTQQQERQVVTAAQNEIDAFCKQMMTSDINYAAIEPQLLQSIKDGLLEGIPPTRWSALIKHEYQLIKKVAGQQRTVDPATPIMRPTNTPSPAEKPRTMMEAMFGARS